MTNSDGAPITGMSKRLKQCQKVSNLVGKLIDHQLHTNASAYTDSTDIRLIDMGCGRGYITFSLHEYLQNKYLATPPNTLARTKIGNIQTQGIDKSSLTTENNLIVRELGEQFNSLAFIEGKIGKKKNNLFDMKHGSNNLCIDTANISSLDILVAMHVCDTAMDDAIWFAITRKTDVILLAPCCQRQLRPQIDRHANHVLELSPLHEVLRHEVFREQYTEMLTDAIRVNILEIAGYDVEIFTDRHIAKNAIIAAVKTKTNSTNNDDKELTERRARLVELATLYGIKKHRLATLMHEKLNDKRTFTGFPISGRMPPL